MSNEELFSKYVMALGTPYPVGESIHCNDRVEMIVRFDFDLGMGGLVAVTDHNSKVSDFYQLADGTRQANITRFFQTAS